MPPSDPRAAVPLPLGRPTPLADPATGSNRLLVRAGQFIFRWRDLIFPVVLLGVGFGTRPRIAGQSMQVDYVVDAAGFAVSLGGQLLRVLVIGLVYITRGGQNRQIWAKTLVESGIFAHCRNPLYLGNFLIITGLAIVHGGWAMYLVAVPFFVFAYSAIVRAEERYLVDRFGEAYIRYCQRVPRWRPLLRWFPTTLRSGRFDWLKVIRKEYGTTFAWLSGFLALLLWEHRSASATALSRRELLWILVVWVALAAAYLTARTLKLRGRLGNG